MENNNKVKISVEGLTQWYKSLNEGHKRLWIVLSCIWVLTFMFPNFYQYYKDIKYCAAAEENIVSIAVDGVGSETYKRCRVKSSQKNYVNYKGDDAILDSYTMAAKYNPMPILWAISMPLVMPFLMYMIAWIRSGYFHDD